MRISLLAATVLAVVAMPASAATVLFSQNFDSLPQGIPAASVPGFSVTGTVDVVTNGNFGITCAGNIGACVDLAGSPGPGTMTTTPIAFLAGRRVDVRFDVGGNQRLLNGIDNFTLAVGFSPANGGSAGGTSGTPAFVAGGWLNALNGVAYSEQIVGSRGFLTYSGYFIANINGTFSLSFSGTGGDNVNIGPLLDNVLVTQAAVPEPASWALLITGFGLVGAARRRQRLAAA